MMKGQMTIYDFMDPEPQKKLVSPGEVTEDPDMIGDELSWSEVIGNYMGKMIWHQKKAADTIYWQALIPEKALIKSAWSYRWDDLEEKYVKGRQYDRLICYNGSNNKVYLDDRTQNRFFTIRED